jgi:enoyl-CoA hydratase/carnithine racemase
VSSPYIEAERRGSLLLLELNRPASRNAFNLGMMHAFGSVLAGAIGDDDVSVVVLAARGPAFCAGVDLRAYTEAMASADGPGQMDAAAQAGATAPRPGLGVLTREPYPKPVVCAVQGPALGLGFELVLACDVVVACEPATFGLPEVRHGLVPSAEATARLVQRASWPRAMPMLLSGEPVDAAAACSYGLVTTLTGAAQNPVDVAVGIASVIAAQPQAAVRRAKALAIRCGGYPGQ